MNDLDDLVMQRIANLDDSMVDLGRGVPFAVFVFN